MLYWEYKTLEFKSRGFWIDGKVNIKEIDYELNRLGAKGWELVSMVGTNQYQGASRKIILVLKRKANTYRDHHDEEKPEIK